MNAEGRRLKPGWILLAIFVLYAVIATLMLVEARSELREMRLQAAAADAVPPAADSPAPPAAPEGLWFPVPGATLPQDDAYLPGAPRPYRDGTSQGFAFYGDDVGVPIVFGTPVVAAADATVERVDHEYEEPSAEAWQALLADVRDGASEAELDRLRGRQVWLRTDDGRVLRYAHLSRVDENLSVGDRVYRGEVIGAAGNSGTDDGVMGGSGGVRVHFEIWEDGTFLGEGEEPAAVRGEAAAIFSGP